MCNILDSISNEAIAIWEETRHVPQEAVVGYEQFAIISDEILCREPHAQFAFRSSQLISTPVGILLIRRVPLKSVLEVH